MKKRLLSRKKWNQPYLKILNIENTKGGDTVDTGEDAYFDPLESPVN